MAKRKRRPTAAPDVPKISTPEPRRGDWTVVLLAAIVIAAAAARLRFLDLPLERDEGEYAYAGQLMLDGVPPYALAYNMKFPGTYAAYALTMLLFGQTVTAIRLGILLLTAATTTMVYVLARKLFGPWPAVFAAAGQALLSLSPASAALWGHATHFVAFFVVAAMLLLVRADDAPASPARIAGAGALLALAVLMKQPGVFFVAFALVYVAVQARRGGRSWLVDVAVLSAGGLVIAAATAALLAAAGVFHQFWFWTVDYARQYVTETPLDTGLVLLKRTAGELFGIAPLLWLIAIAGVLVTPRHRLFVIGMIVAGLLATTPGLYFREHYFIVLFPAVAIAAAAGLRGAAEIISSRAPFAEFVPAIAGVLAIAWGVVASAGALSMNAADLTRRELPGNPFVEVEEVSKYVRDQTAPSDRIAVIGSEPELYFYTHRKSATGYIYLYPLMEKQKFASQMQRDMIGEIERARPKFLVVVSSPTSWLMRDDSDTTIVKWLQNDVAAGRWRLDGIADVTEYNTEYVWGAQALTYKPRSRNVIQVYRRV